jgi:hypothetical protein
MTGFNPPKTFGQPDVLKTIQLINLTRILKPCQTVLEAGGVRLPESNEAEIDYLRLATVLASPDERMDSDTIEGLHIISTLGTDDNFDMLLDIARRNFIEVDLDATACDIAARIWLEQPQALQLKDRERMVQRRRKFESFRARDPENVLPINKLPSDLSNLELDLDGSFQSKKRGIGCRVVRKDVGAEVHFLIQHGQPCKREPSRKGAKSTCTFFRPERTDGVVYDSVNNEFRINASGLWDLRLYREKFSLHLFGDADRFVYAEKYTLAPLQTQGLAALYCRDVGGLESVRLKDLEYAWGGNYDHFERHRADDVFQALSEQNRSIAADADIRKAVFSVRLQGESGLRSVLIQPRNIAEYGRGEEAAIIEQWLRLRGFVLVGTAAGDEKLEPVLAVA